MAPSKNTAKPSLRANRPISSTANSLVTRAPDSLPWRTYALILWPSEQDEKILKKLLAKYKSEILRALMLSDEEVEEFKKFRLDHIWKDTNALYLEKEYPPPESYEHWNRIEQAALLNSPLPMKPTTRERVIVSKDGETAVGVVSGSPSSVFSEWGGEDEDGDDEQGRETRSGERYGQLGIQKKGVNAVLRDTIVFTARRDHSTNINDAGSRLLDGKNRYGLFLKNNDKEHGPGNPYVKREFWAKQGHWEWEEEKDEDETSDEMDKNPKSKLPIIQSRIPIPLTSTRPRNQITSRVPKRLTSRPQTRLPKPKASSKKPSAAAIDISKRMSKLILRSFTGSTTSEPPEPAQPHVFPTAKLTKWVSPNTTITKYISKTNFIVYVACLFPNGNSSKPERSAPLIDGLER